MTGNNEVITEEQENAAVQEVQQILHDTEEILRDAEQRMLEAQQKLRDTEQKLNETKQKARKTIANNLFKMGKSNKDISKATGIPVAELTKISKLLKK